MDDQRANREGFSVKRLLWLLGVILAALVGMYLAVIASLGIRMAMRNYDPEFARFCAGAIFGFIVGIATGVAVSQITRRRPIRFTVRDLLIGTTMTAILLGLLCFALNKK